MTTPEEHQRNEILWAMDRQGIDPIAFPEMVTPSRIAEQAPVQPIEVSYREMTDRDRGILDLPAGFDSIQITLSRFEGHNESTERITLKTGHISLEAVKRYLRGRL